MAPGAELSRKVPLEPWPPDGIAIEVEADARECASLARRFGLEELRSLVCRGRLLRAAGGGEIHLQGRLRAEVVQTCVVSLASVPAVVDEAIERRFWYGSAPMPEPAGDDVWIDPQTIDLEPLQGDALDLGEVVAEELGLALDPYPRAEGADALLPELGPDVSFGDEAAPESPFAVLRALQENRLR